MSDFLSAYSIQNWLESCPQGYLLDTEYGHAPGEREPESLLESKALHEQAVEDMWRRGLKGPEAAAFLRDLIDRNRGQCV
jgi:hypothetical protein